MREKRDCIPLGRPNTFLTLDTYLKVKKKKLYSDQQAHLLTLKNKRGK